MTGELQRWAKILFQNLSACLRFIRRRRSILEHCVALRQVVIYRARSLLRSPFLALTAATLLAVSIGGASWRDPSPHRVHFVSLDDNIQLEVLDSGSLLPSTSTRPTGN